MKPYCSAIIPAMFALALGLAPSALAQAPDNPPRREADASARDGQGPSDGPSPAGPRGPGPGGFGGMMQQETKLVKQFDKDGDKRLNAAERKAAREFLQKERAEGRGPRGFGPRG